LEEYQHVMVKRTYTTEQSGTSSTNRFVQRNYIPTKVVTGATTTPAKVQPNLTGKRKLPVEPTTGDNEYDNMPTPVDFTSLSDKELTNIAKSGFPGGHWGRGAITTGIAASVIGLPATALTALGRGANMYNARQELETRLQFPGIREMPDEEDLIVDPLMSSKETAREMKNLNQRVTLEDRGYGVGGDGQGDAVGAHPETDDLGPDSDQGDTEATWGG